MSPFNNHRYDTLAKEELDSTDDIASSSSKHRFTSRQVQISLPLLVLASIAQLLLGASIVLAVFHFRQNGLSPLPLNAQFYDKAGHYFPAAEAVKYETRTFAYNQTFITKSGLPTTETDKAWEEMQDPTDGTLQLSYDTGFDIDSLAKTNVSTKDSRQNMYGLEVYHQLHCLDYIRKALYPAHYFPNKTEHDVNYHRAHCIEHLRHSIMCSGDFALDYWRYDPETQQNWLKVDVPHVCRSWDSQREWMLRNRYEFDSWN